MAHGAVRVSCIEARVDRVAPKEQVIVRQVVVSEQRFGLGERIVAGRHIVGSQRQHAEKDRTHERHPGGARDRERVLQVIASLCMPAGGAQKLAAEREGLRLEARGVDLPRQQQRTFGVTQRGVECHQRVAELVAAVVRDRFGPTMADARCEPDRGLHDLGDPVGAAAHVRELLAPDGSWMIVEPFAHDRLRDNLNPVGRIYYAGSTMVCTPCSLSQEVGLGLGAQAGELRLRQVDTAGGFKRMRRAAQTPFNLVFEARA